MVSRKEVDPRIPALIANGLQENKRSFFVCVGDRLKDVIVNLHYIMTTRDVRHSKSVLWAYKKKLLDFTSHRKKREKKIKKEIQRGTRELNSEDPFELFLSLHDIRYVFYKETQKILGNTYGMLVLQDFEAITPNTLARTIETVEGGGIVVLLLKGMTSLKQLFTMSMDVHSRYRTEAHQDVVARFNERFILSLGSCDSCLIIDDELNVLPLSGAKFVKRLPPPDADQPETPAQKELAVIKKSLEDTQPAGALANLAKTVDQVKALLTFMDAITEKTLRSTVALTAARGRGKSAALGMAIGCAVAHGYSNIFVTSPSPENLKTLFAFVFKAFDALGYMDHADYSIIQSTNPDFNKVVVRVNVHRTHRQTIQYIRPEDAHLLGQAELVVIDEAAAIPLPLVRKLMGPYLVFLASTINGYEGTGRSLSLKLIKQLRAQSRTSDGAGVAEEVADRKTGMVPKSQGASFHSSRSLREISLEEPIRYARGDSVEKWLHTLLCLDATLPGATKIRGFPDPSRCELLRVNRDTLFSFHPVTEVFLQQLVALFVASHYKNTPDDLQLLSDAPAHEVYVLVPPFDNKGTLPEPLCAIQVALEGKIARGTILNQLSRGRRAAGDLLPWLVSEQFGEEDFAALSGARVVRIATSPDYMSMGYGRRALELLVKFYEGQFSSLSEEDGIAEELSLVRVTDEELANTNLLADDVKVRDQSTLPPLFSRLSELRPTMCDYMGVSFGLTQSLHRFWARSRFAPVYLRQTANDLTGEHTCAMLRALEKSSVDRSWLGAFCRDFGKRFMTLLGCKQFQIFPAALSLSLLQSAKAGAALDKVEPRAFDKEELNRFLTPYDLRRLENYASGYLDYHVILDLVPTLAMLYFSDRLSGGFSLQTLEKPILLSVGLQRKDLEDVYRDLTITSASSLAIFHGMVKKMTTHLSGLVLAAFERELTPREAVAVSRESAQGVHEDEAVDERFEPLQADLDAELEEEGDAAVRELRRRQREMIDSLPLDQYEIDGDAPSWKDAEKNLAKATKQGKTMSAVSVKVATQTKRKSEDGEGDQEGERAGQDGKEKKKYKKAKKASSKKD